MAPGRLACRQMRTRTTGRRRGSSDSCSSGHGLPCWESGRAIQSVAEHDALLDLLESHADADKIELAARDHKLNTLEGSDRP